MDETRFASFCHQSEVIIRRVVHNSKPQQCIRCGNSHLSVTLQTMGWTPPTSCSLRFKGFVPEVAHHSGPKYKNYINAAFADGTSREWFHGQNDDRCKVRRSSELGQVTLSVIPSMKLVSVIRTSSISTDNALCLQWSLETFGGIDYTLNKHLKFLPIISSTSSTKKDVRVKSAQPTCWKMYPYHKNYLWQDLYCPFTIRVCHTYQL